MTIETRKQTNLKAAFRGSFDKAPPAKVLYRLSLAKESGLLKIEHEKTGLNVHFNEGDVDNVTSERTVKYNFNQYLVGIGKTGELQSWEIPAGPDISPAAVMDAVISAKILDAHEILPVFNDYVRAALADVLQYRAGSYLFYRDSEKSGIQNSPLKMSVPKLLIEASRLIPPEKFRGEHLNAPDNIVLGPGSNRHLDVESLKLNSRELRILKLCEKQSTLGDIIRMLRLKSDSDRLGAVIILETLSQVELVSMTMPGQPQYTSVVAAAGSPASTAAYPARKAEQRPGEPTLADVMKDLQSEIADLESVMKTISSQNHFERLGVNEASTDVEVKNSYLAAARRFHPDTISINSSEDVKRLKNEIFAMISESYKMTATAELRASTAQEIGQKGVPAESVDVKNILDAEQKFLRAKMLINRGQGFDEAFNLLSDVIEISRNEPEYRIYYNWSLWLVRGQTDAIVSRAVVKEIHDAMKDHPDENGYMFLGHIYKALGDAPKCEESFKKVLQINPENHSAQVELKMLQKRR